MILDGKIDLGVPAEKAWDSLIDINKFSTLNPSRNPVMRSLSAIGIVSIPTR